MVMIEKQSPSYVSAFLQSVANSEPLTMLEQNCDVPKTPNETCIVFLQVVFLRTLCVRRVHSNMRFYKGTSY